MMAHRPEPQLTRRDVAYAIVAGLAIVGGGWFVVTAVFAIFGQPL